MAQSGPSGIDSVSVKRGQCELNIYAHFKVFPERFSHVLDNLVVRKTSGERAMKTGRSSPLADNSYSTEWIIKAESVDLTWFSS